ncbi:MAG: sugar ABC transporter permease [Clostridiaceae bacterium]|nr:sugar ABC transporter permease [Clostridiaceae bacterium]
MLYKDKRPLIVFIVPSLIILGIFLYYPFIQNIINSFYEISGLAALGGGKYIGIENYKRMFADPGIHQSLKNTLYMMFFAVFFQVGIALVLALMVDSITRGAQFFRTVFFFPVVISATAIGLMFNLFYSYNGGLFNQILLKLGLERVLWLSDELAIYMVSLPVIWQYVGFYFVIILTGLNGIPQDIFEYALLDGVTGVKKTWYISLPLIWDVIKVCLILAITGSLKVFDLPWVVAPNGAPKGLTHFLGTYMYFKTFISQSVGYGAAISVLIVVLGLVVSFTVNKVFKRDTIVY